MAEVEIIAGFRASGGRAGGPFHGSNLLLLHHTGARSGTERVSPLAFQRAGDSLAVFASKSGAPPTRRGSIITPPSPRMRSRRRRAASR